MARMTSLPFTFRHIKKGLFISADNFHLFPVRVFMLANRLLFDLDLTEERERERPLPKD